MEDPALKTPQFRHQREVYLAHRNDPYFALFWEMGLGKTKVIIDVASHLFFEGKIKALIVIAPNSVYHNWINEEIPRHMAAPHIAIPYPKSQTKKSKVQKITFMNPDYKPDHLRVLAISYDSIGKTKHGLDYAQMIATLFPSMVVADESTALKKPSAKQTKNCKKVRSAALYRWIATGTPATEGPFGVHSQIEFLSEDFWSEFGLRTITAFKAHFGVFTTAYHGKRRYQQLDRYRDLHVLNKIIQPISSRLLKEDSEVELPPKTYVKREFALTKKQVDVYDELLASYKLELEEGLIVEAPLAIVRLARLQQVCSGFIKAEEVQDEDEEATDINFKTVDIVEPSDNPRLKALAEILDEANHKVIVWCKFTRDVDTIKNHLGERAIRYDGSTSNSDRLIAIERFKDPSDSAQVLVANVHAMSQGLTLTIAKTMVYYSHSFSLETRLQSEDRNHRIGQDQPVLIIDLVGVRECAGTTIQTVDGHVVNLLRKKFDIAAEVTGDRYREWIK